MTLDQKMSSKVDYTRKTFFFPQCDDTIHVRPYKNKTDFPFLTIMAVLRKGTWFSVIKLKECSMWEKMSLCEAISIWCQFQ